METNETKNKRPVYLFTQEEYDTLYSALHYVVEELDQNAMDHDTVVFVDKCKALAAKWENDNF